MFKDTLAKRSRRNVPLPRNADWSRRANPARLPGGEVDATAGVWHNRIAAENATYLRLKLTQNNGVITAFHGTSRQNAARIMAEGFRDSQHIESGRMGVSGWDAVVALEALRFARDRAAMTGEAGEGMIVEARMTDPHEDSWHGRLEWLGTAKQTEPLQAYSPEDFREHIRSLGALGVKGYDTRDPYAGDI